MRNSQFGFFESLISLLYNLNLFPHTIFFSAFFISVTCSGQRDFFIRKNNKN